ncbi:ADP-ribosylation factor-like protein 6-interacting protein 6 [Clavelina lepadiformis]|uniref:Uncharacterized protein n=1 Tax=Clavelina lepadiformis TaxID=159417 RepID=A0ABP0G898_CLALP
MIENKFRIEKSSIADTASQAPKTKLSIVVAYFLIFAVFLKWLCYILYMGITESVHLTRPKFPNQKHFLLELIYKLSPTLAGTLTGAISLVFCWTLTYFNWLEIGSFPATPLSPNMSPVARSAQHNKPAILSPSRFALIVPILIGIITGVMVWNEVEMYH